MENCLENGRRFRTLHILDDYNREALSVEGDYSFSSWKVVRILEQVRGRPQTIWSDNGPEFIAKVLKNFCENSGINHLYIQKGKPSQEGF